MSNIDPTIPVTISGPLKGFSGAGISGQFETQAERDAHEKWEREKANLDFYDGMGGFTATSIADNPAW